MKIRTTPIEGLIIIEPDVFADNRGFFTETYQVRKYTEIGIESVFVQDNLSFSSQGTLRGLHSQITRPQAKLVHVISGEIFDVAVDLRIGSPTFGKWEGVTLSGENHLQLFIPEGFAHGFCVLSENAYFAYKCSDFYAPEDEGGIVWSDPEIAIQWPVDSPNISEKDKRLPYLNSLSPDMLPMLK